jgi:hypothetical protein
MKSFVNTICALLIVAAARGDLTDEKFTCPSESQLNCVPCRSGGVSNSIALPGHDAKYVSELPIVKRDKVTGQSTFDFGGVSDVALQEDYITAQIMNNMFLMLLAIVPLLIGSLWFAFFCCGRYLCCCCDKGGCCCMGKRYPTPNKMLNKNGELKSQCCGGFNHETGKYGCRAKFCAYMCLILFLGAVGGLVAWGHTMGNAGLTTSMVKLTKRPTPLASMVVNTFPEVSELLVSVAGDSLVPGIQDLNQTIFKVVDIRETVSDVKCVKEIIVDGFLNVDIVVSFLDGINTFIESLPTDTKVDSDLAPLVTAVDTLKVQVPALKTAMTNFNVALNPLKDLKPVSDSLITLDGELIKLKPIPDQISAFFTGFNAAIPSKSTLIGSDGNGGIKGKLQSGIGVSGCATCGDWSTTQAWRDGLRSDLLSIKTGLTTMPSVSGFLTTVDTLGTTLTSTSTAIGDVGTKFQGLLDQVSSIPAGSTLYTPLGNLDSVLKGLDFTDLVDTLIGLNDTLRNKIPPFDPVAIELQKIGGFKAVIPCAERIVTSLRSLNSTLVTLPSTFDTIVSSVDTLAGSLDKAENATSGVTDNVDMMKENMKNLPDFDSIIDSIKSVEKQKTDVASKLDFSGTIQSLKDLDSQLAAGAVDSSVLTQVDDVKNILNDPSTKPDATLIGNLNSLDAQVSSGPGAVDEAIAAIDKWQMGFCVSEVTKSCLCDSVTPCLSGSYTGASAACGGGLCNMRYAAQWPGICLSSGVSCPNGNECSSGDTCTTPKFDDILSTISNLGNNIPDSSALVGQMSDLSTSLNSMPDLKSQSKNVEDLNTKTKSIPDLTTYISQFDSLSTTIDSVPPVSNVGDQYKELYSTLQNLPDLDGPKDMLVTLNGVVRDQVGAMLPMIIDYGQNAADLIFNPSQGLGRLLTKLSRSELSKAAGDGIAGDGDTKEGLLRYVFGVIDTFMVEDLSPFMNGTVVTFSQVLDGDISNIIRGFESQDNFKAGGVHYLLTSINSVPTFIPENLETHNADNEALAWADASGNSYGTVNGSSIWCVTDRCLENTINFVNKKPIQEVLRSLTVVNPSIPQIAVPLSREDLILTLYAFPVLVCLLGLLSGLCVCTGKWNPALCTSLWSYCCSFYIFIIVGLLLFPIFAVLGDFCSSVEDLGKVAIAPVNDMACMALNGTMGNGRNCIVPISGITIEVNVEDIYNNVMGKCSEDPFDKIFEDLGSQMPQFIRGYLEAALEPQGAGTGMMKVKMTESIYKIATSAGSSASKFLSKDGVGKVYSCSNVHDAVIGVKESFCCDFLGSFYVIVFSWYMIGYALLFLGCPTGILGKKRFPSKVWGPYATGALLDADGVNIGGQVPNVVVPIVVSPMASNDPATVAMLKGKDVDGKQQEGGVEMAEL